MPAIMLVKVANNDNVPDSPGKWLAGEIVAAFPDDNEFTAAELPAAGNFYHITVTDKVKDEVEEFLESWRHRPTVTQVSATGNNRVIRVVSDMVSVSGANAFQVEQVDAMMDEINSLHPTANASTQLVENKRFEFKITAPVEARDRIIEVIYDNVREWHYKRRRWYVTPEGMSFLAGNGGVASGPAATVNTFLRDGLLD